VSTAPPLPRARPRAPQQRAPGLGGDPDARAAMAPCRLDAAERGDCASGSESAEGGRYDIKVDGHAARLVLTERGVNLRYQESRTCCSRAPQDEKGPRSGGRGGQPRRSWRCPQTRLASFCILGLPSIAPMYPPPPSACAVPFDEMLSVQLLGPRRLQRTAAAATRLEVFTFRRDAGRPCVWSPRRLVLDCPGSEEARALVAAITSGELPLEPRDRPPKIVCRRKQNGWRPRSQLVRTTHGATM
jgi:hypothetical protein